MADTNGNNIDDEDRRTLFCANLSDRVTEELLYELFIQGGPVESVRIAKDRDGRQRSFGFITYVHACSVPYALKLFHGIKLFRRELTLKLRQSGNTPRNSNGSPTTVISPPRFRFETELPNSNFEALIEPKSNSVLTGPNFSSFLRNAIVNLMPRSTHHKTKNDSDRINIEFKNEAPKNSDNKKRKNPFQEDDENGKTKSLKIELLSRLTSNFLQPTNASNLKNDFNNFKKERKLSSRSSPSKTRSGRHNVFSRREKHTGKTERDRKNYKNLYKR